MKKTKVLSRKAKVKAPDERVLPVVDAIRAATSLMAEETELLAAGKTAEVEPLLERKKEAEAAIAAAGKAAVEAGLSIVPGSPEAQAVEAALTDLQAASIANAEALQGARDAVARVSGMIRKVSLEVGSEGMYGRNARPVLASAKHSAAFGTTV